ncbi:hypothetical protein ANO11243_069970 [Dothideomycetidae sp. 11243]|nr:hypothetical protein ANO11243_069970 [fungal sp. No.11243]
MSTPMKLAVKQQTRLQKLPHGSRIYAYNHILTNQVVYSLDRVLDNTTVLKQLPFAGTKSIPRALRKDHWKPFFVVKFGLPHQGLNAFKKLREWRKLHELSWDPKDVPKLEFTDAQKRTRAKKKEERQLLGGVRAGGARSRLTEWKMRRKMMVMNQKANSVADLAAVLVEQEAKSIAWSPERERLLSDVMKWLPPCVIDAKYRDAKLRSINEEISALEQKIKDTKATTGKKWALPLASRITNLSRELTMKRTEYYQISHLPQIFDVSKFAHAILWEKKVLFEAFQEKEFLIRWQQITLDQQLQKYQEGSRANSSDVEKLEDDLSIARTQLQAKAQEVRDLQDKQLLPEEGAENTRLQSMQATVAIKELKNMRARVTLLKSQLFQTGVPPEWLKREIYEKNLFNALERLLLRKPSLSGAAPLQRSEVARALADALATSDRTQASAQTSSRHIRALAKKSAVESLLQIREEEAQHRVIATGHDKTIRFLLELKDFGAYSYSTTWFTVFPDFLQRYLTKMTSVAPKLTNEVRMSDVSVEWNDTLDAEYGKEWPEQVQHVPIGMARHTAPSEKFEKQLDANNERFKYDSEGRLIGNEIEPASELVPELRVRAAAAKAKVFVRNANRVLQRRRNAHAADTQAFAEERKRLEKRATMIPRSPVGEAIKQQAITELEALSSFARPPKPRHPRTPEFKQALALDHAHVRANAAKPPGRIQRIRGKGRGHYNMRGLIAVTMRRPRSKRSERKVVDAEEQ